MPTLAQIAANLAQVAQDLLVYANTTQPVTYEGEYTATVKKSFTKECASGAGSVIDYEQSSTQKKSSNVSVAEAKKLAKIAAEAEALRLVEEDGQANANKLGNCPGAELINPIPTVAFPIKNWIKSTEVIGLVGPNILWKLTDDQNKSRAYLNIGNEFKSVGSNIYRNSSFKMKTGLTIDGIMRGLIDIETGNGGLDPDPFAYIFSSNESTIPGTENIVIEEPVYTPPATLNRPQTFIYVWGFFWGPDSGTAPESNKTHKAEQSAMSDPRFKHQRPWFATDIPETTVDVAYKYDAGAGQFLYDRRKVNTNWQGTQAHMDELISELRRAKLDFVNFIYYADPHQGSIMRNHYKSAVHKRGLKACYTMGQLGGDMNNKHIPTDEYSINLATFVRDMDADWYLKKDGKPVVFFMPGTNSEASLAELKQHKANIKEAYGKPIYEVLVNFNYESNYAYMIHNGYTAKSWYYYINDDKNGNHNIESVIVDSEKRTRDDAKDGRIIIPNVTAVDERARQHYPGDSVQWDRPGFTGHTNSYYIPNTKEQYFKQVDNFFAIARDYPEQVPFIGLGLLDELSETGKNSWMMKKRVDGSIERDQIDWSAEKFANF